MLGSPAARSGPLELVFVGRGELPPSVAAPLRENLNRRFKSDAVQSLIAAWAMHLDYVPDISGGCWMPFLKINCDERNGILIAFGCSGNMIRALVGLIRKNGGCVVTNQAVVKILVGKGWVAGVRLADGRELRSSRGVVASVAPQALAKLTNSHLPEALVEQANNYRYGPATLMIHLALSRPPSGKMNVRVKASTCTLPVP